MRMPGEGDLQRPEEGSDGSSADSGPPGSMEPEGGDLTVATQGDPEGDERTYLGTDRRPPEAIERALGDFTMTLSVLRLIPLAVLIGALGAGIALGLLDLIGFFTNALYYQRWSVHLVSPGASALGAIAVVVPVGGGLVIGLMARFGSEQIRGNAIP